VSREAFLEIIPIGEIQEFLFDSRDPSRNMEPIQTMLALWFHFFAALLLQRAHIEHISELHFTFQAL
jgi:hypothetical protein